jgi:P-type Ca2+ transporter type 2C
LQFQLSVNITAVVITIVTAFITATLTPSKTPFSVLTAIQLLWVNLIMNTFAALALATDPPSPEEMLDRPPTRKAEPIINKTMWKMIIGQSFYQIVVLFGIYLYLSGIFVNGKVLKDHPHSGVDNRTATIVFNTFVLMQLFNEINCRIITNGKFKDIILVL